MDNQPLPASDAPACQHCRFVRLLPNVQNPLEKVLACFWGPPAPMLAMTQHGPMLMPSTHPPVMANEWCFQFQRGENSLALVKNDPKLLGDDGKSILNG